MVLSAATVHFTRNRGNDGDNNHRVDHRDKSALAAVSNAVARSRHDALP